MKLKPVALKLTELGENKTLSAPKEIQVLRTGKFKHDLYGNFEITEEMIDKMIKNFEDKVRGVDLAVDYSHQSWDKAAGWFKSLSKRTDGEVVELWAGAEWTPEADKMITDKEFRYISADYQDDYQDPETLTKHGPTLFGAALTNRPFIKEMDPVILDDKKRGATMTPEEIKKLQEEKAAADKSLAEANTKLAAQAKDLETAKLAEEKATADKKLAEQNSSFDKMLSEGTVVEAQRKAFIAGDMAEFVKNAKALSTESKGHSKEEGKETETETVESETPGQDKVLELAEKMITENKETKLASAIARVLSENKELNKQYRNETQSLKLRSKENGSIKST